MRLPKGEFTAADAEAVRRLAQSDSHLGQKVRHALVVIDEAIRRYGDSLALSFNGGKDCTVLIHLYAAAVYAHQIQAHASTVDAGSSEVPTATSTSTIASSEARDAPSSSTSSSSTARNGHNNSAASNGRPAPLTCIYVQCQSPFPQVEEFVDECTVRYHLDLTRINAGMKEALAKFKEIREKEHGTKVEAVLIGTRIGDPYAETLKDFIPTDESWPNLMRVHPILDWTYQDIWEFLRCEELGEGGVGWCSLYNYGYTSLGSTFNTIPNPLLRDPNSSSGWRPAWELADASTERAGRPAGPIPKEVSKALDHHEELQSEGTA